MINYTISGGKELYGEVQISGAKNAVLGVISAALLADSPCRIENVPRVSDVCTMLEIVRDLGANVKLVNADTVEIDPSGFSARQPSPETMELMREMRASYYVVGVQLGLFGKAIAAMPGGCDLGSRPIDRHIKGFEALGASIEVKNGCIYGSCDGKMHGAQIYFDDKSVGATINLMFAAAKTEGLTIIDNASKEPHVVDVANFLNAMGADIIGAGTDVIKIHGVDRLRGRSYSVIPDQIEAGTYIAAVAATGGEVLIKNVIPKHLDCITTKFGEMGVRFESYEDSIRVISSGRLTKTNIKSLPYPSFPTDMQPQISAVLSIAEGTSVVTEGIFNSRFKYLDELKRMGVNAQVNGTVAVIEGVDHLTGAAVRACDLRAGAALIVAGLAAQGVTVVEDAGHIERGYEDMVSKLAALGADIKRTEVIEPDDITAVG